MDIIKFFEDYEIPYWTKGKNISKGWVGINCVFCDDPSNHLGYNVEEDYGFQCWKCGKHFVDETIAELIGVNITQAKQIVKKYEGDSVPVDKKVTCNIKKHKMPTGAGSLTKPHKMYLNNRGFDPDYLEEVWKLLGTGPISRLDNTDMKLRIIAPIFWDGRQVSWQSRDITNKATIPYLACPEEREIVHHKNIVYGLQEYWTDTGIGVEGIFDAWRVGTNAVATFGIGFTNRQVRIIARNFKRFFTMFDPEEKAQEKAKQLGKELEFRGVEWHNITLENDPGDTDQEEMNYIVKQILKTK